MKTVFNLKNAVGLILMTGMSSATLAKSVRQYRADVDWKYSDSDLQMQDKKYVAIQKALGINDSLYAGLPEQKGLPLRQSSSLFIKNLLDDAIRKMANNLLYSEPKVIDPGLTSSERNAVRQARLMEEVIFTHVQPYFKNIEKDSKVSGIDIFLTQLIQQVIQPHELEKKKSLSVDKSKQNQDLGLSKVLGQLALKDGKNVLEILGPVTAVEFREGSLHKISFTPKGQTVAYNQAPAEVDLSLSTLLTYRTYQDDAYIQILESLVRYFSMQADFYRAANNIYAFNSSNRLFDPNLNNLQSRLQNYNLAPNEKLVKDNENSYMSSFVSRMAFFNEGQSVTGEQRLKHIRQRLEKLDEVVPFLQSRLQGAKLVNLYLRQLSKTQINQLLGLFLKAHKADILSEREIRNLSSYFSKNLLQASAEASTQDPQQEEKRLALISELSLDSTYLRLLNRQFRDLAEKIVTESELDKAHQAILNNL